MKKIKSTDDIRTRKLPLLMTAAVSTRGMKGACFDDEQREQMYIDALNFYIKVFSKNKSENKIIFVDNSGWDLKRIEKKVVNPNKIDIEYISLPIEGFDISKGKGYNELLMMTKVLQSNKTIKEAGAFFKVTGRYPIYNALRFIKEAEYNIYKRDISIYCDVKKHNLYKILGLKWSARSCDVRLFGIENEFFNINIAPRIAELNDYNNTFYLEDLFYDVVMDYIEKDSSKVNCRFSREPHFGGLEGSDVKAISFSKNQDSFKAKVKRLIGNIFRIFLPKIWF